MKILNLTNNETSDINFEVSNFPDGQQQLKILEKQNSEPYFTLSNLLPWMIKEGVRIKSRLNNFQDLELIICATKSLRELGVKEIHLYTPYFLGSRSDRKFEAGSNNYLKDIICPIINSLKFESVTVIDPHSDVLEACLDNFKKIDNIRNVVFAIGDIYKKYSRIDIHNDKFILISPDAGANKKIFKVAEKLNYQNEIITCSKSRDEQGKLTRTEVPINDNYTEKDLIIIDDICDGGATFINIAKKIKEYYAHEDFNNYKPKIYLIITHGIFSKGFKELNQHFDGIYCTNSYSDLNNPIISLRNDNQLHKVKQLKVF